MLHQKIIFNLPKIVIFIEFRGFIVFLTTDVCVNKIMCELEKAWLIVLLLKKKKKAEALVSVLFIYLFYKFKAQLSYCYYCFNAKVQNLIEDYQQLLFQTIKSFSAGFYSHLSYVHVCSKLAFNFHKNH